MNSIKCARLLTPLPIELILRITQWCIIGDLICNRSLFLEICGFLKYSTTAASCFRCLREWAISSLCLEVFIGTLVTAWFGTEYSTLIVTLRGRPFTSATSYDIPLTCSGNNAICHRRVLASLHFRIARGLASDSNVIPLWEIYRVQHIDGVMDKFYLIDTWVTTEVNCL